MNENPADHAFSRFYCTSCGKSFDAPISCGNRFCGICSARRRAATRSKLNFAVASMPDVAGFDVKFLTLTIPNQENLKQGTQLLVSSFRRLRQRSFWANRVLGGCYVIEICGSPHRWHIHLHAIIQSRYIPVRLLSRHWSKCSPGKIVYITRIPLKQVVNYVTKYITKSALPLEWQRIASADLKHLRLFQPFGIWHDLCLQTPKYTYCCPHCDSSSFIHQSQVDKELRQLNGGGIAFHPP